MNFKSILHNQQRFNMSHNLFEHPIKEHIKALLRLEKLFNHLSLNLSNPTHSNLIEAIQNLIAILRLTDRPDIKSKIIKYLYLHQLHLESLCKHPEVDTQRLGNILAELRLQLAQFKASSSLVSENLSEHTLLNNIKSVSTSLGTTAFIGQFATQAWLDQDQLNAKTELLAWQESLSPLNNLVALALKLSRQSKSFKTITCDGNFFSQALDPGLDLALIRIKLPKKPMIIPEISAGRHHLAIHFYEITISPTEFIKTEKNTDGFELSCCS